MSEKELKMLLFGWITGRLTGRARSSMKSVKGVFRKVISGTGHYDLWKRQVLISNGQDKERMITGIKEWN